MTFTRTEVDGQPALNFQWTEGDKAHEIEVQYSHGASSWVGALFPGGWADAAQRGGFQLPQRALYHPPNP
jgi:hypothetical protein